jgi:hypothetical protein
MIRLIKWLRKVPTSKPYVHPLAQERRKLADLKETMTPFEWYAYLETLPFELYSSWLQEPYPGPGDLR